jgi:PAS domain-containing protein
MEGVKLGLALLSTLLSGTLLGVWLRHRATMKQLSLEERKEGSAQNIINFDTLLAVVTKQRDEAYAKIGALERKIELLEFEIQGLRLQHDADPFPSWIVDLEGRHIFANREFEIQFLEPKGMTYRSIMGEGHSLIWPPAFCKILDTLDVQARQRPDGRARAVTTVEGRQITVHKFPLRIKGVVVAYTGYITDIEPLIEEAA